MRAGRLLSVLLCAGIILSTSSCRSSATSGSGTHLQSLTTRFRDTSGGSVATGTLFLPSDAAKLKEFTGTCRIRVLHVPQQPKTELDHALRCLSQNDGKLSGRITNGVIRIELGPQVDDNTVYLQGRLEEGTARGKWSYQSFAGFTECGTFEATVGTSAR